MKKLFIVGAGGFGREVLWLTERINSIKEEWNVIGFIDDNKSIHGTVQNDLPILGGCDYFENVDEEVWVICAIGSAKVKQIVVDKLVKYSNVRFATLIDPSVIMSNDLELGEGCILCAGTILTVNIKIGKYVIINLDCTLGHDDVIQDYVTIYPSVNISGNVKVGECTEVGTGTQIIQGKCIGDNTIVGAGSVVINDIDNACTAVGCPAKVISVNSCE